MISKKDKSSEYQEYVLSTIKDAENFGGLNRASLADKKTVLKLISKMCKFIKFIDYSENFYDEFEDEIWNSSEELYQYLLINFEKGEVEDYVFNRKPFGFRGFLETSRDLGVSYRLFFNALGHIEILGLVEKEILE